MRGLRSIGYAWCLLASPVATLAQVSDGLDSARAGRYAFVLHVGGGLSWYPRAVGMPAHLHTTATPTWPLASVRLMWRPDHRLSVGLESGWVQLFGYSIDGPGERGSVQLTAVPLLLMWSMPIAQRFRVYAGYGTYRLTSTLDYYGTTRASTFSLGYAAAFSYVQPLSEKLGIEAEVEWMNAAETRHTLLCLQARLVWKLFQW